MCKFLNKPKVDTIRPSFLPVLFALLLIFSSVHAARAAESVSVEVQGLHGDMLENVEAALTVPEALVRDGQVDRRWLSRFRQQIPENVRRAMMPFGYFEPSIQTELKTPAEDEYHLIVQIEKGPPVRVAESHVALTGAGAEQSLLRELIAAFPLQKGNILRQNLYEQAKGALKARALDLGYLNADFAAHEIRVNREAGTADIDLVLDTGPRFHFGQVSIEGGRRIRSVFCSVISPLPRGMSSPSPLSVRHS